MCDGSRVVNTIRTRQDEASYLPPNMRRPLDDIRMKAELCAGVGRASHIIPMCNKNGQLTCRAAGGDEIRAYGSALKSLMRQEANFDKLVETRKGETLKSLKAQLQKLKQREKKKEDADKKRAEQLAKKKLERNKKLQRKAERAERAAERKEIRRKKLLESAQKEANKRNERVEKALAREWKLDKTRRKKLGSNVLARSGLGALGRRLKTLHMHDNDNAYEKEFLEGFKFFSDMCRVLYSKKDLPDDEQLFPPATPITRGVIKCRGCRAYQLPRASPHPNGATASHNLGRSVFTVGAVIGNGVWGRIHAGQFGDGVKSMQDCAIKITYPCETVQDCAIKKHTDRMELLVQSILFCHQRRHGGAGAKIPKPLFGATVVSKDGSASTYIGMQQLHMTVEQFIKADVDSYERWKRWKHCLTELCVGLMQLQKSFKFVHGDMHSKNVMVTVPPSGTLSRTRVFIIDFGFASLNVLGKRVYTQHVYLGPKFNPSHDLRLFIHASLINLSGVPLIVQFCKPFRRGFVARGKKINPAFPNHLSYGSLYEEAIYSIHDSATEPEAVLQALNKFDDKNNKSIM